MTQRADGIRYEAFGGRVVFYVAPYATPRMVIQADKIRESIPNWEAFSDVEKVYFTTFTGAIPYTYDIEFNLSEDASPALLNLQRFWSEASQSERDWPRLWELFLDLYDIGVVGGVWNTAINSGIPLELRDEPILATPLPSDERELENLPEDHPLSEHGKVSKITTPKPSVKKSATSANPVQ